VTALRETLGLGDHELVALVGGGGKSTLMFGLGYELAEAGRRVIMTTTTKMGREQALEAPTVCWSADADCAIEAMDDAGPVMLVTGGDDHKVTGPMPEIVDRLFAETNADYVIVEADGSWRRPLKAPAAHEPVIPVTSTTVVILMGMSAVGQALQDVTHRVDQAILFTGLPPDHLLSPSDCARILIHPDGALRVCPPQSRILVGLTQIGSPADIAAAQAISAEVSLDPRVSECVLIRGVG
jgi:probable selenium-dependent hydroxylase accessory protein YqeC